MIDRSQGLEFAARSYALARTEQLTLLAAAVAFYAFLSLVPLMLLSLAIASTIGGEPLATRVANAASDVLTPPAQQLLAESLVDASGRVGATVVGALGVVWGASRVLRGLDRAFSEVYGTAGSKSLAKTFWDSAVVFVAISLGLGFVGALEVGIELAPFVGASVVAPVLVLLGLFVAFLPLYVIFPEANVSVRRAFPGAALAAVGWFTLSRVFAVYAAVAGSYAFYGAIGAVFLVLVWLYVGAAIVVFGAVVNAVLADVDVDRQLQSPGARQFSTEGMTDDATGPDDDVTGSSQRARTRDRSDDPEALREEIERLRDRVDSFEEGVESRTVKKESLERELKGYVRSRVRRSHARGWGPYLVLLYGTALAIAAFMYLDGIWAILAMFVVWTSVLGVYVLMVLFGAGLSILGVPGRLRDRFSDWRS